MKHYRMESIVDPCRLQAFVQECDARLQEALSQAATRIGAGADLRFLGLTGPTCSGKTTAAKRLTTDLEAYGRRVHVISIDDFYYDKEYLHKRADDDPDIEIDYDSEDTIDVALLAEKTELLLLGRETELPHFDFQKGIRTRGERILPKDEDLFLFEGIQILYPKVHEILCGEAYHSIYICPSSAIEVGGELFLPNELRLMRRLVRDFRYRATDPAFTLYLWQSVRENEEKNIFPYAHDCKEKIDSTMPYEVGMLKPYLEELLQAVSSESPFYQTAQEMLTRIARVSVVPSSYMASNSLYKEFI